MKSILLIEDDDYLSQILTKKLIETGYKTDLAFEGEKALWMLSEKNYDLIILDIGLPGINGINVLAKIRGSEKIKNIPVIILTNKDSDKDLREAKQLGVNKYLIKSNYNLEEILNIIKSIVF